MGKSKQQIPPVSEISKELKNGIIKNIYFLFGEDSFSIDNALNMIEKKTEKFITTDFDRESFYGENISSAAIVNAALSFPFGSEKKLIIIRDFEKVKERKDMIGLLKSPPEFLILILLNTTPVTGFETEFYKLLIEKGFIYEAKELKGKYLVSWLMEYADSRGKILTEENARVMIDITGENRSLLELQVEKIITFLGDLKEITRESILSLSTALKEYNIFDLQNAIGKKNKKAANKIVENMLEKGAEPVYIVYMLVRYFTGIARISELNNSEINKYQAARIVGTHHFYYEEYQAARQRFSEADLRKAVRVLMKADESLKTSSFDGKTAIILLINELLS